MRMLRSVKFTISFREGSEGPTYDPYSYAEVVYTNRRTGRRVIHHAGLGDWIEVQPNRRMMGKLHKAVSRRIHYSFASQRRRLYRMAEGSQSMEDLLDRKGDSCDFSQYWPDKVFREKEINKMLARLADFDFKKFTGLSLREIERILYRYEKKERRRWPFGTPEELSELRYCEA